MDKEHDNYDNELIRGDHALFSSLLRQVVQAAPDEDPVDFVLAAIGRNAGADRCCVYRFWEPGKSSMCTNTHEWCADGITSEIDRQHTCNLADLVDFNAHITSGRDFMFTDVNAIDSGSRRLAKHGIKSLIATPLARKDGVICGFVGFDFIKAPCEKFTDRIISNIHEAAGLLLDCQLLHERNVALDLAHFKGEIVEFIFNHRSFEASLNFIGEKTRAATGAQHLLLCASDGSRADWFGEDAPSVCRDCARTAANLKRQLPDELFANGDSAIIHAGTPLQDKYLPRNCPMLSSVVCQLRRGSGWWRIAADYTDPHKHNLDEVARDLHEALKLLAIAYERERHEETIARQQKHQRYRADLLAYALSKDDLPGLIDVTMHRLLELTACDYIAIHNVDGDHLMLHPDGDVTTCPGRCTRCSFYKLKIPPVTNPDNMIELNDAHAQTMAPLPHNCPAKSLEVVVVYSDGKPWGGIALHYLDKQYKIADDDRQTLKIAADVLTLALERHSAAVRLKAERDRALEAEKTRSYFFSAVSHDIRTPLNAIIGFSELLQSGGVSPDEAKQSLKLIVSSGKMLLQLVNDALDLSRMDLGQLKFNREPTDVGELIRQIAPLFQQTTSARNQTIVMDIPEMPILLIDPHRIRQVLFNFISNAVKYAGPCTIRISAAYENGRLKITVADNGKGVPAEKAKLLMQPFVQADINNRSEGCGLGLAICKRLAELAQATISIDTAPGKGFSICVDAPISVAPGNVANAKADGASPVKAVQHPMHVLVVDDSPVNRKVLTALLKRLGITDIELAEDGKEALEKLNKDLTFDLVLSDIWMPVMDGTELVKRIRADARLAPLKVCSITADVEVRATCKDKGFDMLILKPVTLEKMSDLLGKMAN